MPGSVLTAGIVGGAAVLAVGLVTAGSAAVFSQRLASAADAAALAAADTASGLIAGVPCERAAEISAVSMARIESCDVDGLIATVTVGASFGGLAVTASARAGPPP